MRVCKRFAREALAKRSELKSRANSDKPSCTCLACVHPRVSGWEVEAELCTSCLAVLGF